MFMHKVFIYNLHNLYINIYNNQGRNIKEILIFYLNPIHREILY